MITEKDVEKLATLSRIKLSADEAERMKMDMGSILAYVDELKKAPTTESKEPTMSFSKNILREDVVSHEPGSYTESILNSAPRRDGKFVAVKKIL